jgi:hypothetical protein
MGIDAGRMATSPARPPSRLDVPFRRLLAISAIVFFLLLAFLAGRVRAGADPTQAGAPSSSTSSQSSGSGSADPGLGGQEPYGAQDPYGGQAIPNDGGSAAPPAPDADPPSTFAS